MINAPESIVFDFSAELAELKALMSRYTQSIPFEHYDMIAAELMNYLEREIGIEYSICDFVEAVFDHYFLPHLFHDEVGKDQSIKNIKDTLYRTGMYVHHSLKSRYKVYLGGVFPYRFYGMLNRNQFAFKKSMELFVVIPGNRLPFSFK